MESSVPSADATAAFGSHTNNKNGKLLDLADLDGYLLSLLSSDLAEAFSYALLAKKNLSEGIFGGETANANASIRTSNNTGTSSSSWWKWEDLLLVATIWASHGETPGARALGVRLVDRATPNGRRHRFSFWLWLLGASASGEHYHHHRTDRRGNSSNSFRNRIFLYAILRVVLPRLYERLKARALEYAHRDESVERNATEKHETDEEPDESQHELSLRLQAPPQSGRDSGVDEEKKNNDAGADKASATETAAIRALALQRRKLVLRKMILWLDGAILPSMRLALLLSCWAGVDGGHGGNLALWWSGLSYQSQKTAVAANPNPNASPPTTPNQNALSSTVVPLFVLYAHRRWFHKEATELLWNKIGKGLLAIHGDTSAMCASVAEALRNEWRMRTVRWSYRFYNAWENLRQHHLPVASSEPCRETNDDDEACALCGTNPVVVPYRLAECCGKVACYVCLWERLAVTMPRTYETSTTKLPCPICGQFVEKCEPA
jgi:hypothetical protein